MSGTGFNTRAVGSGEIKDEDYGNVVTPIFENATFIYPNNNPSRKEDKNTKDSYIYSRWGNPTVTALEEKYASLEGATHSLAFSSGMAAITTLMLSLDMNRKKILSVIDLYGQTLSFFKNKFTKMSGNMVELVTTDSLNDMEISSKEYGAVYLESITNPSIKVADIKNIGKKCREEGVTLIVDATFASPFNQNPLEMGSDFVVHSGTKYLNGHSDTMSGFIGSNRDLTLQFDMRKNLGGTIDSFQAYLVQRGMKTLGLRMERHNKNAMEIAEFLQEQSNVLEVFYPGLEDSPYHQIAKRNLKGYGGMLSFRVKGGLEGARKFIFALKHISPAPSLGGVESLVTLPVDTSHGSVNPQDRKIMGVTEDMVRLSVGIEDSDDLIEDISRSLSQIA
ncbi:trans-sulfuration enzyme family protein [Cuniculiplasma sp. SKW3]|uniref:trans-sulfuration enzyme family protein n=1 Tax=unclassified Cuniculiplasma TaxID=2619706 RepID=UPI003FD5186F